MQVYRNTVFRILAGFGILVFLATCAGITLYLVAPALVQHRAQIFLRDKGVEVELLHVNHVGFTGTDLGGGSMSLGGHSLGWESVDVQYVPSRLVKGQFDHLLVSGPVLEFHIPAFSTIHTGQEKQPAPDDSLEEFVPDKQEEIITPSPGRTAESTLADRKSPDSPDVVEIPRHKENWNRVMHRMLGELPFLDGFFGNGRLAIDWAGVPFLNARWDGYFVNDPERFNGDLRIDGELLESVLTLQVKKASPQVSLFGEAEIDPDQLMDLFARLPADSGLNLSPLTNLAVKTPVKGEFLLETTEDGAVQISSLASIEFLDWQAAFLPVPFQFSNLLLIAAFEKDNLTLEGGGRFLDFQFKDLSLASFGMRLSRTPQGLFLLETEKIEIDWKGWSGNAAVKGQANPALMDEGLFSQFEVSFNELTGPHVRIEPASLLLEASPSLLQLGATAIGIERNSTLWVEELEGELELAVRTFQSGFTWYSAAGALMGDVAVKGKLMNQGGFSGSAHFQDTDGKAFLKTAVLSAGEELEIDSAGQLSLMWLNALGKWWWGRFVSLSGSSPFLDLRLSRAGFIMKGNFGLRIDSLNLSFPDGPVLEGISGDLNFKMNGLPRSEGRQTLIIDSLTTGSARINSIIVEASLPTLRNLIVSRLSGKIGKGDIYLDQFSVDPLKPDLETTFRFEGIPAQQLLDWLGEKRFALQGTVSGSVPLHWKDGVLFVGQAGLQMDSSASINRFLFSDQTFLEEQFSSMTGVPADLKEPFLATLLADGIRIRDLTLSLVPYRETGQVALKLKLSGETRSESMEVPIESLIINNVISDQDLGRVLGLFGAIQFMSGP